MSTNKMQYGWRCSHLLCELFLTVPFESVRLGKSGLKVSKIILGCMSYGTPQWQGWVLPEEEAIKHIKFACVYSAFLFVDDVLTMPFSYDHGIQTFDTANV